MIRLWRRSLLFGLSAAILLSIIHPLKSSADEGERRSYRFLPQWVPQAQFAGYYMALHKGFYQDLGIDLTILQGGPSRSGTAYLKEKKTDIASLWLSSALQLADQGTSVVNAGQILQRSALVLVAKKSSGIDSPNQMNGKKMAVWPADFQIQPRAFFKKFQIQAQLITTESPVNLFLRDGVQMCSVMWYNEYHALINSGLDPEEMVIFFFEDFDLNFPEDGIYFKKEVFEADPKAARAFVAASMKGWRYAFEHPDETLDVMAAIMTEAHIPVNRVHQKWMLERMEDLMKRREGEAFSAVLSPQDFQRVRDVLLQSGLIGSAPLYDEFIGKCSINDPK
jgi:NitT/TauT family transport system substrate-binding protein